MQSHYKLHNKKELFRSRNFSISGGKIINKGDSFQTRSNCSSRAPSCECLDFGSRRSSSKSRSPSVASSTESVFSQASYTSPNSLNSPISPATVNSPNSPASVSTPNSPVRPPRKNRPGLSGSDTHSLNSRNSSIETCPYLPLMYRIVVLGSGQVGKSSIISQFLTSDHVDTFASVEDTIEKEVVINVDGKESHLIFIDYPHGEIQVEDLLELETPDGILAVLAVDDDESLTEVENILKYLKYKQFLETQACIVVGNKIDLVRSRTVSTSGTDIITNFNSIFQRNYKGTKHLRQVGANMAKQQFGVYCKPTISKQIQIQFIHFSFNMENSSGGTITVSGWDQEGGDHTRAGRRKKEVILGRRKLEAILGRRKEEIILGRRKKEVILGRRKLEVILGRRKEEITLGRRKLGGGGDHTRKKEGEGKRKEEVILGKMKEVKLGRRKEEGHTRGKEEGGQTKEKEGGGLAREDSRQIMVWHLSASLSFS
ncbi:uncharacterized protein LOC111708217 [Eurytemora carolleeae]|uniref:uncharacterized protein LOC111708217 n=1 Tax=Eurytemora carolleeae TaxID=1294199 RepID=UPI000C7576DD|nr:uncharacterized protein LOC111708217 [Eurytemora carolleeae]|eukprot:XP_023337308.1 uncharacterized protein LOC111708217 [Eurytemora affinis]